jgi:tungstate transport system ATP-binding protein
VSEIALSLHNVGKRHGKRVLFQLSELAIERGRYTLLSGPNGAGKSTLLRIIAGLEAPDRGEVQYRGCRRAWAQARRHYAGEVIYLHQDPYLFDTSVAENVAYGLRQRRLPAAAVADRVASALEWAHLSHLSERHARELSGGERQQVALVRAWVLDPQVLLLDEPMSNLDQAARLQTRRLIEQLKSQSVTMVVISHDAHHLAGVGDAFLHLENGRLQNLHAELGTAGAAVTFLDRARRPLRANAINQETS